MFLRKNSNISKRFWNVWSVLRKTELQRKSVQQRNAQVSKFSPDTACSRRSHFIDTSRHERDKKREEKRKKKRKGKKKPRKNRRQKRKKKNEKKTKKKGCAGGAGNAMTVCPDKKRDPWRNAPWEFFGYPLLPFRLFVKREIYCWCLQCFHNVVRFQVWWSFIILKSTPVNVSDAKAALEVCLRWSTLADGKVWRCREGCKGQHRTARVWWLLETNSKKPQELTDTAKMHGNRLVQLLWPYLVSSGIYESMTKKLKHSVSFGFVWSVFSLRLNPRSLSSRNTVQEWAATKESGRHVGTSVEVT